MMICRRFRTSDVIFNRFLHSGDIDHSLDNPFGRSHQHSMFMKHPIKRLIGEIQICVFQLSVDGGWSVSGTWSTCSVNCGSGTQSRTRLCNNPAPAYGGNDCIGDATETRYCNNEPCPG